MPYIGPETYKIYGIDQLERTRTLLKLAAGELVKVPWLMIVDDARIRFWVNYYLNAKKMEYSPQMDAVVPTTRGIDDSVARKVQTDSVQRRVGSRRRYQKPEAGRS